jgi:hypothetical protein
VGRDRLQRLVAIHVLTARREPKLHRSEIEHDCLFFCGSRASPASSVVVLARAYILADDG